MPYSPINKYCLIIEGGKKHAIYRFKSKRKDHIKTAERIKDNMYELAKTGRWLGGNTPLGYKSKKIEITEKGKTRSQYQLETNEYDEKEAN